MVHLCKGLKEGMVKEIFRIYIQKNIEEEICEVKKVKPLVCYLGVNIVKMHP
jgi:hypothetical protein